MREWPVTGTFRCKTFIMKRHKVERSITVGQDFVPSKRLKFPITAEQVQRNINLRERWRHATLRSPGTEISGRQSDLP